MGERSEPPYRVIATEIRARIESGDLAPGDRVPSIRQIAQRWGVAVATATRAAAVLRDEGLVAPSVGAGTVVTAAPRRAGGRSGGPPTASRSRRTDPDGEATELARLLQAAITVADEEGIDAVSMRRLAAHLGVRPMSLYRSVANKDELLRQMSDRAFGEIVLPAHGPDGWRAKLETASRAEWELYKHHLWLPRMISFTRPSFAPNMLAHTEWVLRALDGLGLSMETRIREALTIHTIAMMAAVSLADEHDAEQESGLPLDRCRTTQGARARAGVDPARFPLIAAIPPGTAEYLDALFEYGLARHLDGFAVVVSSGRGAGP